MPLSLDNIFGEDTQAPAPSGGLSLDNIFGTAPKASTPTAPSPAVNKAVESISKIFNIKPASSFKSINLFNRKPTNEVSGMEFKVGEGMNEEQTAKAHEVISGKGIIPIGQEIKAPFLNAGVTVPEDGAIGTGYSFLKATIEAPERILRSLGQTVGIKPPEEDTVAFKVPTYQETAGKTTGDLIDQGYTPSQAVIFSTLLAGGQMAGDALLFTGPLERGYINKKAGLPIPNESHITAWDYLGRPKTIEEAKINFRNIQKEYHPDISGSDVISKQANNAWQILQKEGIPAQAQIRKGLSDLLNKPIDELFGSKSGLKPSKTRPVKALIPEELTPESIRATAEEVRAQPKPAFNTKKVTVVSKEEPLAKDSEKYIKSDNLLKSSEGKQVNLPLDFLLKKAGLESYKPGITFDKLANEIKTSGKIKPLSVTTEGDIVDGFHRLNALKKLGVENVPVFVGKQLGASGRLENEYQGLNLDVKDFYKQATSKKSLQVEPKFNKPEARKTLPERPVQPKRVTEYQDRLKLRGADPVLVDTIITPEGARAYGVSVNGTLTFEKIVEHLTEDHEVFHQVFSNMDKMRVFKDFKKTELFDQARDVYGDLSDADLEENLAKDFQQYVNDKESGKSSSFWGKIKEFFDRLYTSIKQLFKGKKDIEDFYKAVHERVAKEETAIENKASEAFNKQRESGVVDFSQPEKPKFNTQNKLEQLRKKLDREQQSLDAAVSNPEAHEIAYGPGKIEEYKKNIADLKEQIREEKFPTINTGDKFEDVRKILAHAEARNGVKEFKKADKIIEKVRSIPPSKIIIPDEIKVIDDQASAMKDFIEEAETTLKDHPGKVLQKFESEGVFQDFKNPDMAKTPKERQRIIERNRKVSKVAETVFESDPTLEGLYDNPDVIRDQIEEYRDQKENVEIMKQQRADMKKDYIKKRNDYIEKERNRVAMNSIVAREERFRVLREVEKILRKEGRQRNEKINDIQDYFKLTDKEMKDVRGNKDFRLLSDDEFENLLKEIEGKAYEAYAHREAVLRIEATIHEMELRKTDNLREAMKMRKLENMSLNELNAFNDLLETFQHGDEFLGRRQIQTAGLTDLGDIKTHREALDHLAKETGVPIEDIRNVKVGQFDRFLTDITLQKRNPLYKVMVENVNRSTIASAQRFNEIKQEFQSLMEDARKSRKRGLLSRLAPTDDLIFDFQEATDEQRVSLMKKMTPEEIKAALYIKQQFARVRDHLMEQGTLKRYRRDYITHMRRDLLEIIKTEGKGLFTKEGFKAALQELWDENKLTTATFNILDDKTGEILPLEKFFKYSVARTGNLKASRNVGRVFLEYMRVFEQKRQLDSFIPKLDIFTHILTPKRVTEGGVIMDDTLNTFVKKWLNSKKGRIINTGWDTPGGKVDVAVRFGIAFTRLHDLAFNYPVGLASNVGAQLASFVSLGTKNYIKGVARSNTKQGKEILSKYEPMVGEKFSTKMKDVSKNFAEKSKELSFSTFSEADRRAKSVFFLANLTPTEFRTGEISNERLGLIKLEMARYFVVEGMKSMMGKTALGSAGMQYKTWALPLARSTIENIKGLVKVVQNSKEENPFKSREVKELSRVIILTTMFILIGYEEFSDLKDKKNKTFLENLAYKSMNDALSMIGALDPGFWTVARTLSFLGDLGKSLGNIVGSIATGSRDSKGNVEGAKLLKTTITPALINQLFGNSQKANVEDSLNEKITAAQKKIDAFDSDIVDKIEPIVEQANTMEVGSEERDVFLDEAFPDTAEGNTEFKVYKAIQAKKTAEDNLALVDKIKPIVEKANTMEVNSDERNNYLDEAFPDTPQGNKEFEAYQSIKNSLYGESGQKNTALKEWDQQSFVDHVSNIAKAIGTDPVTAFNRIFTGDWRIIGQKNGTIIVQRMSEAESQKIKKAQGGATQEFKLDHIIPLKAGGTNTKDNLQLITTEEWESNTEIENYLSKALGEGKITGKQAREYAIRFKGGQNEKLSDKIQKEYKEKYNSKPLTFEEIKNLIQ